MCTFNGTIDLKFSILNPMRLVQNREAVEELNTAPSKRADKSLTNGSFEKRCGV